MSSSALCEMYPSAAEEVQQVQDLADDLKQGIALTTVGVAKPMKRRTTFSISPEHMREAQSLFREPLTIVANKKNFFGDIQDSQLRRDSAIDLDDDDDDVITPPPVKADTDYTPHEINAKDYMDKVLRGKIQFSPLKKRRAQHMDEVKKRVVEKAVGMPEDGVLMVKSTLDQVATLVLPDEIKT